MSRVKELLQTWTNSSNAVASIGSGTGKALQPGALSCPSEKMGRATCFAPPGLCPASRDTPRGLMCSFHLQTAQQCVCFHPESTCVPQGRGPHPSADQMPHGLPLGPCPCSHPHRIRFYRVLEGAWWWSETCYSGHREHRGTGAGPVWMPQCPGLSSGEPSTSEHTSQWPVSI